VNIWGHIHRSIGDKKATDQQTLSVAFSILVRKYNLLLYTFWKVPHAIKRN